MTPVPHPVSRTALLVLSLVAAMACNETPDVPVERSLVTATPAVLDFGEVALGSPSLPVRRVTVRNDGDDVVTLVEVLVEPGVGEFVARRVDGEGLPLALAPGESVELSFTFQPGGEGLREGVAALLFEAGPDYTLVGGGCAGEPAGDEGLKMTPAPVSIALTGSAVRGTDEDPDGDGVPTTVEDANGNGRVDDGESDPDDADSDDDGVLDGRDGYVDTDGDSLLDAMTDTDEDGQPGPLDEDRDGDGLHDGTEEGVTPDTAPDDTRQTSAAFIPDRDPKTTSNADAADTDGDGCVDGDEDVNRNGMVDEGESDPTVAGDCVLDPDGDGLDTRSERDVTGTDPLDADSDDDGVPDGADGVVDDDGDGTIDAVLNSDGTGPVDPLDPDSDGDGLLDGTEAGVVRCDLLAGADGPGGCNVDAGNFLPDADLGAATTDPRDADSDDDGLPDGAEDSDHNGRAEATETDASRADTDGDGLADGLELGLTAGAPRGTDPTRFAPDADPMTTTDPLRADTDEDGLEDGPLGEDTDGDGAIGPQETDPSDADTDDDGLRDGLERLVAGTDPLAFDTDDDALGDGLELGVGLGQVGSDTSLAVFVPDADTGTTTDPDAPDTDGDGLADGGAGGEDASGNGRVDLGETDPGDADTDDDGLSDGAERSLGLGPLDPDTDDDGLQDGLERGLALGDVGADTARGAFTPDLDPTTTTDPDDADSDDDGCPDGVEDANANGRVDSGETDPERIDCPAVGCVDADEDDWFGITGGCPVGTLGGGDCDDGDALVHPGAEERCGNVRDDDCDGTTDDGCSPTCADADDDGFAGVSATCPAETPGGGDCDDSDARVSPDAAEICRTERDEDCDGETDEPPCVPACADRDEDGAFGISSWCPADTVGGGDCDDDDASVFPGAPDHCGDGRDDDCDGQTDEEGCTPPCVDGDEDGVFGITPDCPDDAAGGGDCDDEDPEANPGQPERCDDGRDDDCDGTTDEPDCESGCVDGDGDQFFGITAGCPPDEPGGGDCNDGDASVRPNADEQCGNERDDDCDGDTDESVCAPTCVDGDFDGFFGVTPRCPEGTPGAGDCDDTAQGISPSASERCGNRVDDDCDGSTDEEGCVYTCVDGDGDGWFGETAECPRTVPRGGDCDDEDAAQSPDEAEACGNATDDDCDGTTDERECVPTCTDADLDGYLGVTPRCPQTVAGGGDCNDGDAAVNPGRPEICANGRDDNCQRGTDEADCVPACVDGDGDGYGAVTAICPVGSTGGGDCDDTDRDVSPAGPERCANDLDDDCDGTTDEAGCTPVCVDGDGDGFGAVSASCPVDAPGGGDCDDGNPRVNPSADERCANGIDDDCDGAEDEAACVPVCVDRDGDGYVEASPGCPQGSDCNDRNPSIHPGVSDAGCDNVDEDCDGSVDEDLVLIGGFGGCEDVVPTSWTALERPRVGPGCTAFDVVDEETVLVDVALETPVAVGPELVLLADGMRMRTLPVGVEYLVEKRFQVAPPGAPVAAEVRARLEDYVGDELTPGSAIYLSNGRHGVWLNLVRHGVYVLRGPGDPVAFAPVPTQGAAHTYRLVLLRDADVRVLVDGEVVLALRGALADATPDAVPRVRLGDWSLTAGADTIWGSLGAFTLPVAQQDVDGDGVTVCEGDCDDASAAVAPTLPEDGCDARDNDCDPATAAAGGFVLPQVASCRDRLPDFWTGASLPSTTGCPAFDSTWSVGTPSLALDAGALRIDTSANLAQQVGWTRGVGAAPTGDALFVARAHVRVERYVGPKNVRGNALSVWNGAHALHVNVTDDRLVLLGASGSVLGEHVVDTTGRLHELWLVVRGDVDALVILDGRTVIAAAGAVPRGEPTPALGASFGDRDGTAGATVLWADFGLFALVDEGLGWLDVDGDGIAGCAGDCAPDDPARHPGRGDVLGNGLDDNCNLVEDEKPYAGTECYDVSRYPDGWNGQPSVTNAGVSSAVVGDVNGDGLADVAFNHGNEVYLAFGTGEPPGLSSIPAEGYDVVIGSRDPDDPVNQIGRSGIGGGDLNGDGYDDLVLGSYMDDRVYVFFGRPTTDWAGTYDARTEANLIVDKTEGDYWSALSVAAIADVNGDGQDELGIRAMRNSGLKSRFYVFFGRAAWEPESHEQLQNGEADVIYTDTNATYSGSSVGDAVQISGIGDFDGDGYRDMAFGAPGRNSNEGSLFVVFGGAGTGYWPSAPQDLPTAPNVLRVNDCCGSGVSGDVADGAHVAPIGDVNGDGYDDLVHTGRRRMYVVLGRPLENLPRLPASYDPSAEGDYVFYDPSATFPFDLAYAGDVDGDGYDDILVTAGEAAGPDATLSNVSYLLYGRPTPDWPQTAAIRDVYDACFHHGPSAVSAGIGTAGDLDGDGTSELLFSAPLRHELRILFGDWN